MLQLFSANVTGTLLSLQSLTSFHRSVPEINPETCLCDLLPKKQIGVCPVLNGFDLSGPACR
jgi:hypothetical protein